MSPIRRFKKRTPTAQGAERSEKNNELFECTRHKTRLTYSFPTLNYKGPAVAKDYRIRCFDKNTFENWPPHLPDYPAILVAEKIPKRHGLGPP